MKHEDICKRCPYYDATCFAHCGKPIDCGWMELEYLPKGTSFLPYSSLYDLSWAIVTELPDSCPYYLEHAVNEQEG